MNNLLIIGIILLMIMQLLIPALFIYWTGFRKSKSKTNLILKLLTVWIYFIYIFYAGNWSFLPYLCRYIFLFLLIVTTIKALLQFNSLVIFEKKKIWDWIKFAGQFLFSLFFFLTCIDVINGFKTDEKGIEITFPLKEGFISHAGNSVYINYHHMDTTAQQYALDITKLNSWGLRAAGFFPSDLNKYTIYGDTVFSPCDGKIVNIKDGLENLPLGTQDKFNLAGNNIILEYNNNLIIFAHLLKNSLMVSTGDFVKKGQPIARVGNSGNTTEPHLHIHAISGTDTSKILNGNGIPIYFDGRFLKRNDIIKRKNQ
jgi:hypothetical protein